MPRIVAIIQARLGSTRLPGKVLEKAGGRTILEHVVRRVQAIPDLAAIVVAIPDSAEDDRLAEAVESMTGVSLFRGSRDDVLDRYYRAAKAFDAQIVLRITADCPLLDPQVTASVISALKEPYDIAVNNAPPTFPHGLDIEVFRFSALEAAWREAADPEAREHVGPFLRRYPERFRLANVACARPLRHHRWTVDEPKDLEFLRAIVAALGPDAGMRGFEEIVAYVEAHPEVAAINSSVPSTHVWDDKSGGWKLRIPGR